MLSNKVVCPLAKDTFSVSLDARPQIVAALTPEYDGIYCIVTSFSDLVQAAFQPMLNVESDDET